MTDKDWATHAMAHRECHEKELEVTILAWADQQEERGNTALAEGLRMLADGGKHPHYNKERTNYTWMRGVNSGLIYKSEVPEEIYSLLVKSDENHYLINFYRTAEEAYLDAARAFVEYKSQEETP
jgi:hypothetical protein